MLATTNTVQITLDEAYWWLNFTCGNLIRPSLQLHLSRLKQAVAADQKTEAIQMVQDFIDNEIRYMESPLLDQTKILLDMVKLWDKPSDKEKILKVCDKYYDCGGSYLNSPIYSYVLSMRVAVEENVTAGWNALERLLGLSNRINNELEAGELLVECGWAAYKMQNLTRAAQIFEEANRRYNSRDHQVGVVFCILGTIYWELNQLSRALVAWRNSISRFSKLAEQRLVSTEADLGWYQAVLKRLNESLTYIVENRNQPAARVPTPEPEGPGDGEDGGPGGTGAPAQAENPPPEDTTTYTEIPPEPDEPVESISDDFIEIYPPVLGKVPAGEWKEVSGDPNIKGRIDINVVFIDNKPYYVRTLRGKHLEKLPGAGKTAVVKITGNSMNAARPAAIEDGDYVLVRVANSAHSNDIVVATIYDKATSNLQATIKRYKNNGRPILKAESTEIEFQTTDEQFEIFGIALAVFKPAENARQADTGQHD